MQKNPVSIIEAKRDGRELDTDDIRFFVDGLVDGSIPDYQASAWAMAVYFRGMSPRETADLTLAMRDSGRTMAAGKGDPPRVDKHSTGGVGDKVSLVLAPLLASAGFHVPMVSGRGLGITGGTLDKLESIPGFRSRLTLDEADRQLERLGVVMIGQTDDLCPADRMLYALRDVTGTVPSRPLIVASILSKKLAESLDRLVVDVKFGSGAFMHSRDEAELLELGLREVAERTGLAFSSRLTPMGEPLGRSVGNALEVAEAVDTLQGRGPGDLIELVLDLAADVSGRPIDDLERRLRDGSAWKRFIAMVEAQGGDAESLETLTDVRHRAPVIEEVRASGAGRIAAVDAGIIGSAAVAMGAGRRRTTDRVDPAVGFDRIVKTGDIVARGDVLIRIHAADNASCRAATESVLQAIVIEG